MCSRAASCVVFAIGSFAVGGCATVKQMASVTKPDVSFKAIEITGISPTDFSLQCELAVENPGPASLSFLGYSYDVKLFDQSLVAGELEERVELAAGRTNTVSIPLKFAYTQIADLVLEATDAEEVPYDLGLVLAFDLPVAGPVNVPIRKQGRIPLLALPAIRVSGMRVKEVTYPRVQLECEIEVDNPNALSMVFESFHYEFLVNGRSWVETSVLANTEIAGDRVTTMDLPMTVDFGGIGYSAFQLLLGGQTRLNYDLQGVMKATTSHPMLQNIDLDLSRQGVVPF